MTEISSDVLDDGEGLKSAEREPVSPEEYDLRLCPECSCVQAPRARDCPQCGHKFFAVTLVHEREEELVELGCPGSGSKHSVDERQWHAGLVWLRQDAMQRGKCYAPKWVAANFRERFGHWPDRSWPEIPKEPTVEIRNWVRSKQIAFAKARAAHG